MSERPPASAAPSGSTAAENDLHKEDISSSEVKEVMEKFDRESRTREFSTRPVALLVTAIAVLTSLYHMYTSYFGTPPTLIHRSLHVGVMLALTFALYPAWSRASRSKLPIYDTVMMLLAGSTALYIFLNYQDIVRRGGRPETLDLVFACILVVLVLDAARRVTGWALPILATGFIVYGLVGRELPGLFRHRGFDLDSLLSFFYLTTEGVYGTAISVSASYIFLFVLFGAVLQKSGMGAFFNDIALALAGQSRGGPAKVAVISSGFLGSINGAAVANVVTTGAFTIPLMKKVGYTKNFAGAVEATASVGGQILPPIMGASAFIMAETLGLPYREIAIAAIVPALLYYLAIIAQVHLRATAQGLEGISRKNLPLVREVMKERGHLLLPLIFLLYMLFFSGRTIIFSALLTILVTLVVAQLRPATRMSVRDIIGALDSGARSAISVAVACATVGLIVGVVTLTGFGVKLANAIVTIGGGNLILTLVLTMVASIILGMGLPSIPTYIVTATMAAPALTTLGVEPLVAHMFVFYFGLYANITPPVALASYAAAGLSGGDPMRTGLASMKLAMAGYLIPYMFVLNPALLLQDVTPLEIIRVILTGVVGVLVLSVAVEGHFMSKVPVVLRLVLLAGAILLMSPDGLTDMVGAAVVVGLILQSGIAKKRGEFSLRNI